MATKTRQLADYLVEGGLSDEVQVKPHIQPGLLYPAMRKFKKIGSATGTAIGNMTTSGAIANAFNGQTYAHWNASARKDPSEDAFIGKDWGSGNSYKITRFKVWAPYNYALAGTTASRYMKLQGSNDNSSWTDLYEDPDIIGNYQIIDVSAGITTTTAYRYHRLFFEGDANGGAVAELEFYTEDNPGRVYLADKETAHSGAYGTAQSDGKKYYYTEIQGSKPIKDPRIGAHFGSQRHKTTSVQLLKEETAAHGLNVYSIDGREWMRAYGSVVPFNNAHGTAIYIHDSTVVGLGHLEIVGYFSDINLQALAGAEPCDYRYKIDGGSLSAVQPTFVTSSNTPLGGRYVSRGSSAKVVSGQTLGIHTLTLMTDSGNDYLSLNAAELIAQDTSNRNNIQIPSQNVVSYGKKFTVSGTPHYAPVNGFTHGRTTFGTEVDTATSLGLGLGTTYGAPWAISNSNHIRPFNGGRVVKWVDSSGTIKTSVTMMPRNAQNFTATASNEITTASATNSHTINFSDDPIENSLSEVAKVYHVAEFGNGSANGGEGSTWQDFSMLKTDASQARDCQYCMDDGLTSMAGNTMKFNTATPGIGTGGTYCYNATENSSTYYVTFIGTGISIRSEYTGDQPQGTHVVAQNLPYGTHILKVFRTSSHYTSLWLNGVQLANNLSAWTNFWRPAEFIFHQPKKPPVPEDSCIIADYMLMADFVALSTTSTSDLRGYISKGVRFNNASRDHFCDMPGGGQPDVSPSVSTTAFGLLTRGKDITSVNGPQITYFGETKALTRLYHTSDSAREFDLFFNGTAATSGTNSLGSGSFSNGIISGIADGTGVKDQWINTALSSGTLGANTYHIKADDTDADDWFYFAGTEIITPTHTSSHYQTFETPYLKELVGGDRNMEQNNLIVTADGKSWDEVTRDTSYIENMRVHAAVDENFHTAGSTFHFDYARGTHPHSATLKYGQMMIKDFAQAYDRHICLVDGWYEIVFGVTSNDSMSANSQIYIKVNGVAVDNRYLKDLDYYNTHLQFPYFLRRGDYVQCIGATEVEWSNFHIKKI